MAPPPMKAARLPAAAPQPARAPAPKRPGPPLLLLSLLGLGGVALIALVVAAFALPGVVRARCIAAAADRGVTLTVDSVGLSLGSVRLSKVGFKLVGVPQLQGAADAVDVGLEGLTPTNANATALTLTIDGPAEDVQTAVDAWRAAQAKKVVAGGASGPASKLSFAGARLVWTRAFGATAKLEALDAQGELDAGTDGATFASEKVTLSTGRATFGPWRATLDRGAQGTRTHVELDPVVHGGPQATYVRDPAGASSLKMTIPASPLSRLGVPAKAIGLASDPTVDGSLDFEIAGNGAATLVTSLTLKKAVFSGIPLDAKIDLSAAGDATKGLDVKKGELAAGPVRATITGTVKLFPDGVRLALAWRSVPIPCATLAKQMQSQVLDPLGSLGTELGALADRVSGAVGLKVTGEAVASGLVTIDSRDVASTTTAMTTNETCGMALF